MNIINELEKNGNQENINNISDKDDKFLDEYISKKEKKLKKTTILNLMIILKFG